MNLERILAVRTSKTVYRDGDKAIKVFDSNYSKADVLNEALNQARIEETGLDIPKIHSIETLEGKWAIISDFIPGKTMEQLMKENPEKKSEYLARLVELQLIVHSMKAPLLNKLKDKLHRKIALTDLDATTRYELHTRLEGMPKHNKVCHGDFNPSNIIITPEGKAYILDWSHATQGNAAADAACTYFWFCLQDDKESAQQYLDLYCEKSDTAKQYVQKWMPIMAASKSLTGNEQQKAFILSWVNVVDYE